MKAMRMKTHKSFSFCIETKKTYRSDEASLVEDNQQLCLSNTCFLPDLSECTRISKGISFSVSIMKLGCHSGAACGLCSEVLCINYTRSAMRSLSTGLPEQLSPRLCVLCGRADPHMYWCNSSGAPKWKTQLFESKSFMLPPSYKVVSVNRIRASLIHRSRTITFFLYPNSAIRRGCEGVTDRKKDSCVQCGTVYHNHSL